MELRHSVKSSKTGGLGNKRRSGHHPSDGIVEIGQNTEKSRGDSLYVTRSSVEKHQLTLV